jgi:hypothetical protein
MFGRGVNHFFGEAEVNPPRTPDGFDPSDDYRHSGGRYPNCKIESNLAPRAL